MLRSIGILLKHSLLGRGFGIIAVIAALVACLWIPKVAWLLGLEPVQRKISLFTQATYWSAKVKLNHSALAVPDTVLFGDIKAIRDDGVVMLLLPQGKKYVLAEYVIGNVRITNVDGLRRYSHALLNRPVRLDIYSGCAVVWDQQKMINIDMIENNVAEPQKQPPTPAFYLIWANYLWAKYAEH